MRALFGERLVAGINIATLAGLPLACGVYLAANRLLPVGMDGRADAELRPGLQGHARVVVGQLPPLWGWCRAVAGRARVAWWAWVA